MYLSKLKNHQQYDYNYIEYITNLPLTVKSEIGLYIGKKNVLGWSENDIIKIPNRNNPISQYSTYQIIQNYVNKYNLSDNVADRGESIILILEYLLNIPNTLNKSIWYTHLGHIPSIKKMNIKKRTEPYPIEYEEYFKLLSDRYYNYSNQNLEQIFVCGATFYYQYEKIKEELKDKIIFKNNNIHINSWVSPITNKKRLNGNQWSSDLSYITIYTPSQDSKLFINEEEKYNYIRNPKDETGKYSITILDITSKTTLLSYLPYDIEKKENCIIENENSFPRQDTIKYIIGSPEVLFYDGFENGLDNWTLDDEWGLTENAANGQYALSDSPEGDYGDAQTTIAELSYDIDLSLISIPSISFKAKWDIEPNYDFVRIEANVIDEGWISLEGNYTSIGTGQPAQPFGEPGYDDIQQNWVEETIFLDQLNNAQIIGFRFIQTSDNFVEGDGFSFDDFSISGFPNGTMGDFNLDTEIDIFDLLGIADAIIFGDEPSNSQLLLCDLDGSGVLNIMDLILLTNIIMSF